MLGSEGSVVVRLIVVPGLSCLGGIYDFSCGSASLKFCICSAASPWAKALPQTHCDAMGISLFVAFFCIVCRFKTFFFVTIIPRVQIGYKES